MTPTDFLAWAGFAIGLGVTVGGALLRFTMSQLELRLATAERRIEALQVQVSANEKALAVVTSQHDGTTGALRRIESQLAKLTAHMLGRVSTHEREGDE